MMDNEGEDGFREWKATQGWSLLAHTVIPWASLTWLWELWQPTGSLSCLCVQLPRTFLHPPLPGELCSFAHKIPSIRFFYIEIYWSTSCLGVDFLLATKKRSKVGTDYMIRSAYGECSRTLKHLTPATFSVRDFAQDRIWIWISIAIPV